VPLGTLRDLIHQRGERLLSQLREGPIGRLIPGTPGDGKHEEGTSDVTSEAGPDSGVNEPPPSSHETTPSTGDDRPLAKPMSEGASSFEHWRHVVDERIRMILPSFIGFRDLQQKVDQLAKRVAELEEELARRKS
jgi:hypothetical protein